VWQIKFVKLILCGLVFRSVLFSLFILSGKIVDDKANVFWTDIIIFVFTFLAICNFLSEIKVKYKYCSAVLITRSKLSEGSYRPPLFFILVRVLNDSLSQ